MVFNWQIITLCTKCLLIVLVALFELLGFLRIWLWRSSKCVGRFESFQSKESCWSLISWTSISTIAWLFQSFFLCLLPDLAGDFSCSPSLAFPKESSWSWKFWARYDGGLFTPFTPSRDFWCPLLLFRFSFLGVLDLDQLGDSFLKVTVAADLALCWRKCSQRLALLWALQRVRSLIFINLI